MTHTALLMQALDAHGRTTYAELMAAYGGHGYTKAGFVVAAFHARKRGVVAPATRGGAIVKVGRCPCCGRAWGKGKTHGPVATTFEACLRETEEIQ